MTIAQTTNNNAFAGFGTQRPNLVGDPELSSDERSNEPMVQYGGVGGGAGVHDWVELAQSGPRARG